MKRVINGKVNLKMLYPDTNDENKVSGDYVFGGLHFATRNKDPFNVIKEKGALNEGDHLNNSYEIDSAFYLKQVQTVIVATLESEFRMD